MFLSFATIVFVMLPSLELLFSPLPLLNDLLQAAVSALFLLPNQIQTKCSGIKEGEIYALETLELIKAVYNHAVDSINQISNKSQNAY